MFHMITDNFYYFLISCTGDFSVCSDAAYMRNPENKIKCLAEKKKDKARKLCCSYHPGKVKAIWVLKKQIPS